jgi:electron transfer flavoprotein alpha subunit
VRSNTYGINFKVKVINSDPEAPFFKVADGIVGDALVKQQ